MTTTTITETTDLVKNIKADTQASKALLASGAQITDNNELLFTDPQKNIKARITVIQQLSTSLKNQNFVGKPRVDAEANLVTAIEQYILFCAACINNNLIEQDEYGIMSADANKKYFKGSVGHINAIAKKVLAKQEKVAAHNGAKLSETELAKLIATPFNYVPTKAEEDTTTYDDNNIAKVEVTPEVNGDDVVEITCVDGSTVVVDKNDSSMYVEVENEVTGEKITFKRKVIGYAYTWYETAKNIATAFLGLAWDLIKSVAMFGGSIVTGAIGTITGSAVGLTTNLASSGSSFMGRMKSAHARAKEKALLRGILL